MAISWMNRVMTFGRSDSSGKSICSAGAFDRPTTSADMPTSAMASFTAARMFSPISLKRVGESRRFNSRMVVMEDVSPMLSDQYELDMNMSSASCMISRFPTTAPIG